MHSILPSANNLHGGNPKSFQSADICTSISTNLLAATMYVLITSIAIDTALLPVANATYCYRSQVFSYAQVNAKALHCNLAQWSSGGSVGSGSNNREGGSRRNAGSNLT